MHGPTSVVVHLPELLGGIFEQGLEPYTLGRPRVAIKRHQWLSTICLVSTLWRDVTYSIPELWSLLQVDYPRRGDAETTYEKCFLQLERAKKAQLDLFLNIETIPPASVLEFWRLWEAVRDRTGQWRSVRIGRDPELTCYELRLLLPSSLPNLVEAEFGCVYNALAISTPKLRELRLTRQNHYTFIPFLSTQSLETLHFAGLISNAHLLLGKECPNLRNLYLINGFQIPFGSSWTAELPNLHCIEVRGTIAYLAARLGSVNLVAPRWEFLRIICNVTRHHLQKDVTEPVHFPSLTTIEYESRPCFSLAPLRSFLSTFRETRSLTIKLSTAILSEGPKFQSFRSSDADFQWMEERVAEVAWIDVLSS